MKKLDKKTKQLWIEALLSGRYKQGRNYLHCDGKYCCLGVLGAVAKVRTPSIAFLRNKSGDYILVPEKAQRALARLNDFGVPFEVIAGLIDEAL